MNWEFELNGIDQFLLVVSVKAGLVLAFAWAGALLLRACRCSPATRHAVWAMAIGGVIVLPVFYASLPPWSIPLPAEQPAATAEREPFTWRLAAQVPAAAVPTYAPEARVTHPQVTAPAAIAPSIAPAAPAVAASEGARIAAGAPWLSSIWLVGACLMLAPAILGWLSLWRLGRSSREVASGPLFEALGEAMERLGMKGKIRLIESRARSMPMTWGIRRPTILLPEEAGRWPADRLRIVLLHELAHVRRRDCLSQVLVQIARGIYWFNPLSWLAERQLRSLMEQACDDVVITGGFEAPDYAEHLLAISADCRPPAWAAGMAMARASRLERRLSSILSPRSNRRPLTRRRLAVAAVLASALIAPLSIARLYPAAALEAPTAGAQDAPPPGPAADSSKTLDELRAKIAEQYVNPVDDKEIIQSAIKAMVGALHDPYSDYLTPEMVAEMEKHIGGTIAGIGAQLEARDGKIHIVTPLPDSPALSAGLEPGDAILQIDGASTDGLELSEGVKRIVGPAGTDVTLNISREGREMEVRITRGLIKIASVKGFRRGPDHRWDWLLDPAHRIGYVQVTHFGNGTAQELRQALDSLRGRGMEGLILDLRSCPGGLLESAVEASKLFVAQGTIVSIHGRGGEPHVIAADGSSVLSDTPLVVLVNGETASAAEVFAGALKDNQRALVMGTRTLGKGSVQTLIKLEDGGGAIKLTTARYQLPSGRNIDKRNGEKSWGIDPDDGFFVPVDQGQAKERGERRQARELIGKRQDERAARTAELTPQRLEREEGDAQLAAALKTLIARLEGGQFPPVNRLSPAEIEAFLKREEIQRRRTQLEKDLERLRRELDELGKE